MAEIARSPGGRVEIAVEAAIRNPATGGGAATWTCGQFANANQACANDQFAKGVTAVGALDCAAPASSGGSQAFSTTTNGVVLAGRTSVLSKTLPPGSYVVFASVELVMTFLPFLGRLRSSRALSS